MQIFRITEVKVPLLLIPSQIIRMAAESWEIFTQILGQISIKDILLLLINQESVTKIHY
jgi:hypothetical protein